MVRSIQPLIMLMVLAFGRGVCSLDNDNDERWRRRVRATDLSAGSRLPVQYDVWCVFALPAWVSVVRRPLYGHLDG